MTRVLIIAAIAALLAGCSSSTTSNDTTATSPAGRTLPNTVETVVTTPPSSERGLSTPEDFRRQTEQFVEGPTVARQIGVTLTQAECAVPTAMTVGTTYKCAASAPDGTTVKLIGIITGPNAFELTTDDGATPTTPTTVG